MKKIVVVVIRKGITDTNTMDSANLNAAIQFNSIYFNFIYIVPYYNRHYLRELFIMSRSIPDSL